MNSYIITGSGITVFFAEDSSQHTIKNDHPRFADICKMAAEDRFDEILVAIDVRAAVSNFIYTSPNGRFSIEHGNLTFDGTTVHTTLADRMIDMAVHGLDITAMENFMINLFSNPSHRAVTELYNFLEAGNLPITSDGHFLAYKKVREDFTDVHSGTFDNSVGSVCSMPRNQVNEDKDITCSTGLHFCSFDYLDHFGGSKVVVLKINPRDVVSIPADYRDTKGRCCQYEVIRELENYHSDRIEGFVSDDGRYDDDDEPECFDCGEIEDECTCEHCLGCGDLEDDCLCEDFESDSEPLDRHVTFIVTLGGGDDEDDEDFIDEDDAYVGESEFDTLSAEDDEESDVTFSYDTEDEDDTPSTVIKAFDMRNNVTYFYDSIEDAHAETNVPLEYIRRVLKGQKGSSLGYTFEEVEK